MWKAPVHTDRPEVMGPLDTPTIPAHGERSLGRWLLWIAGVTITIVTTAYATLIASSDRLTRDQQQLVLDAVSLIDDAGFSKEAFALRHLVSFRRTDNWWNRYVGHQTAFAATNFPFGVVTLYPAFFRFPKDDVERAAILLHEAHHVFGADELSALQRVWLEKRRLGWTADVYGRTRVWRNTREWTETEIPSLFSCGPDGQSDCLE